MWKHQQTEKPIESDVINEKHQDMSEESTRTGRQQSSPSQFFTPVPERRVELYGEGLNEGLKAMVRERLTQDRENMKVFLDAYRRTYGGEPPTQGMPKRILQDSLYIDNLTAVRLEQQHTASTSHQSGPKGKP